MESLRRSLEERGGKSGSEKEIRRHLSRKKCPRYCLSEAGTLVVLSAGEQSEVLSTTSFGEGPCMSSVVVSGGKLLIRTAAHLICLKANP